MLSHSLGDANKVGNGITSTLRRASLIYRYFVCNLVSVSCPTNNSGKTEIDSLSDKRQCRNKDRPFIQQTKALFLDSLPHKQQWYNSDRPNSNNSGITVIDSLFHKEL
jgi:hypothetical protein